MPVRLMYAKATVKARSFFICTDCGAEEKGETVTIDVDDNGVGAPEMSFTQTRARNVCNQNMPVGWAGYGRNVHRCPKCAK